MLKLQNLKVVMYQRLTAAVDDIIGHLERTITEYEEEMGCRHRKLLGSVSEPADNPQLAEVQQQLFIKEEQQERSLNQEYPEDPNMKEEEEDSWTSTEGGQMLGLQKNSILMFPLTHLSVKNEDDEEKPQSSHFHQRQTENNREAESPASSLTEQMKTETEAEGCSGLEPEKVSVPGLKCLSRTVDKTSHSSKAVTGDSGDDWKKIRELGVDLDTIKSKVPGKETGCTSDNKLFSCPKCYRRFGQKHHLKTHMRCHTGEKPFSCSLCGKRFTQKGNLTQHLTVHTREKPCNCPVCGERFAQKGNLTQHMTVHTREKLCW